MTQQWNVTYYALLLEAALVGVGQLLGTSLKGADRLLLAALAVLACAAALYVIAKLQRSISVRQTRLDATRRRMSESFQRAWSAEHKDEEKVPNVLLLRGGIVITALLTVWLVS